MLNTDQIERSQQKRVHYSVCYGMAEPSRVAGNGHLRFGRDWPVIAMKETERDDPVRQQAALSQSRVLPPLLEYSMNIS